MDELFYCEQCGPTEIDADFEDEAVCHVCGSDADTTIPAWVTSLQQQLEAAQQRVRELGESAATDKAIIAGQYKAVDWKTPVMNALQARVAQLEGEKSGSDAAAIKAWQRVEVLEAELAALKGQRKVVCLECDSAIQINKDTGEIEFEPRYTLNKE